MTPLSIFKRTIQGYFRRQYQGVMTRVYREGRKCIAKSLTLGGYCLDCGAGSGHQYRYINEITVLPRKNYFGIEWDAGSVSLANSNNLQVRSSDLNRNLSFANGTFQCVVGFSVLEHLTNGCQFMSEAHRVLKPGGHLILITPNLSAWFNIFLLGIGKMPSSGPHPDSEALLRWTSPIEYQGNHEYQLEKPNPTNRHFVVFTYKALKFYLKISGFRKVECNAYGLYAFPKFMQPFLEKVDPWHCHQVLVDCEK